MATTLPRLTETEIVRQLANRAGWQREGHAITREFVCPGFTGATQFVARIAPLADAMDHHPDVLIHKYKRVKVTLWTHSVGGLTQNDFELAAKIDALAK